MVTFGLLDANKNACAGQTHQFIWGEFNTLRLAEHPLLKIGYTPDATGLALRRLLLECWKVAGTVPALY